MSFLNVTLRAGTASRDTQPAFYGQRLGFRTRDTAAGFAVSVGETELVFVTGEGAPFYHFALLVPGDRFEAAHAWINARTQLLPHADSTTVEFPAWDAQACYFHDPAGNIVELIAHRGMHEHGTTGPFAPSELIGLSELGLVGDPQVMAAGLERAGLTLWDGTVNGEKPLGFVGEKARTLILARAGRGWLPTWRPAERHPAEVTIEGAGALSLEDGLYRLNGR